MKKTLIPLAGLLFCSLVFAGTLTDLSHTQPNSAQGIGMSPTYTMASDGTAPANVWVDGIQLRDATTATAGTVGQVGSMTGSLDHVLYTRNGGAVVWQCGLDNIAATLTQCQGVAGAGLSYYVTGWIAQSTTSTGGQMTLESGTGTNCGTGTAALLAGTATARFGVPPNTSAPSVVTLPIPIKLPAAAALCVLGVATNTTSIQITGYTAP